MTVGGHGAQFGAFDQQQQAVQVITHILRRHGVLRLTQQLAESFLRNGELPGLAFADRHARKIIGRQGLQAEAALAGTDLQALVFEHQADVVRIGQRAKDFLQFAGANRHCAVTLAASPFGRRGDLDFNIGSQQRQALAPLFQ